MHSSLRWHVVMNSLTTPLLLPHASRILPPLNVFITNPRSAAQSSARACPHVKHTPERIYATQVEPRSRQRQRILVGWQGHPQTKIDAKELTWQAVSDFERPVGPFRAYEVLLLDPFVSAVAASPDGSARGWPFKKVGNGNDKYVWIHPSAPAALATYIRTHPTTTMQTGYD